MLQTIRGIRIIYYTFSCIDKQFCYTCLMFKQTLSFFWEIIKVAFLALVIVVPIRYFIFQPFIVKGASMEPNFRNGDYLIVDEISYRFRAPERGEVIVFKYPNNLSEKFIKRVIGLPGEYLKFDGGKITITKKDGSSIILDESYYLYDESWSWNGEISLGETEYFVLGDNRLHSYDSRNWGVLPQEYIIGRTIVRVFPPKAAAYFSVPAY